MRAGQFLDAVRRLPTGSIQELTRGQPFVVLAPHPDDESLGAGGLIAQACEAGQAVELVVVSDGAGSHPRSTLYPRERLMALRRSELEQAADLLGLPHRRISHLGLPDTKVPRSGPAFDAAVGAILAIVRGAGARSLFTTWASDPHCDHEATAGMALAVRRLVPAITVWAYPVWGWHLDPSVEIGHSPPRGFRIDISRHQARKRAALAAHVSQMTDLIGDDPDGFHFSGPSLAPFLGSYEYFFEVAQ